MSNLKKKLFILIGPKGSGKTYIGRILNKEKIIKFLEVEPFFLKAIDDNKLVTILDISVQKEAYKLIKNKISELFASNDSILIEQTGAIELFNKFYSEMQRNYDVFLIKISAPQNLCLKRIKDRTNNNQINMSSYLINKINKRSAKLDLKYFFEFKNTNLSTKDIISMFKNELFLKK